MPRESVIDLAERLLTTDDPMKVREVHRLAAFVLDHAEHLEFDAKPATKPAVSGLLARIAPDAPSKD